MPPLKSQFYVAGGTLPATSPSYVARSADRELLEALEQGEFCYVLTSRQMGKSSLMVRTANRLRAQGTHVVVLDLTAIGQNVTPEQWYDGLVQGLGRQLGLEDELDDYLRSHTRIGPCQRTFDALRDVVLARRPGRLAIFVDEIDAVRSLRFGTDEFFSAIRETYNRRSQDPGLNRITFCLLGVATPADLIRDPRTTPFNIGRRIQLSDFTLSEAAPLASGLRTGEDDIPDLAPEEATVVLNRVLYWTGGQPFLTQRLCRAVMEFNDRAPSNTARIRSAAGVDRLCRELFLSHKSRETDDNLHFVRDRLLKSDVDRAGLLDIYKKIRAGKVVPDDETNPLVNAVQLSGVARADRGRLVLRNRIYKHVFDRSWINRHLPEAEKLRQRQAFRRGMLWTSMAGVLVLAAAIWLTFYIQGRRQEREVRRIVQGYETIVTYEDECEVVQDLDFNGIPGVLVTRINAAIQKATPQAPANNYHFDVQIERPGRAGIQMSFYRKGTNHWVVDHGVRQYLLDRGTNAIARHFAENFPWLPEVVASHLYPLMTPGVSRERLGISDLRLQLNSAVLDGDKVRVASWQLPISQRLVNASRNSVSELREFTIPVTAWYGLDDGLLRKFKLEFPQFPQPAAPDSPSMVLSSRFIHNQRVVTIRHTAMRINPTFLPGQFEFIPPSNYSRVRELDVMSRGSSGNRAPRFESKAVAEGIPARNPLTPENLIDLTTHYNARLDQAWHSAIPGNDLDTLPRGVQTFDDVTFDIRGVVQLAGTAEPYLRSLYPDRVRHIAVQRFAKRLHFLHATGWSARDGQHVGSYVIHYADGETRTFPILYGFDVRNWHVQTGEPSGSQGLRIAWTGSNPFAPAIRLYRSEWLNPLPEKLITTIDFISTLSPAAPFLIALSADP